MSKIRTSSYRDEKITIVYEKEEIEIQKIFLESLIAIKKINSRLAKKYHWTKSFETPFLYVSSSNDSFATNNFIEIKLLIQRQEFTLYNSSMDDRQYFEELDKYENFEKFLIRKVEELSVELNNAFKQIKKTK